MTSCVETYCGTGSGNFPKPGDPNLNDPILSARPRFGGIEVSWTYPAILPEAVAHTQLYRSLSAAGGPPEDVHVIVSGNYYFDAHAVEQPTTYFYWIRMVSVNGTIGDYIGPVSAVASPMVDDIIEAITGHVANSVLNTELREQIARITDVASAISDEEQNRLFGDNVLTQLLNQIRGDLDDVDTRVAQEVMERITADSALVAQVNMILAKANDNAAAIQTEQVVRANADGAIAQQVDTLQATVGDTSSSIQTVQQAVNDINLGLSAMYTVRTDVNGYVSGFGLYNDGQSSDFIVNADTFAITTPGVNPQYPFIVSNLNGTPQIVVNAPMHWGSVYGEGMPESGATRNVHRGNWSTSLISFKSGDIVSHGGRSWMARIDHSATNASQPPSGSSANTWWELLADKGEAGEPGEPGPRGFQGIQGPTGSTGSRGASTTTVYRRGTSVSTPAPGYTNPPSGWSATVPNGSLPLWEMTGTTAVGGTLWTWKNPVISAEYWTRPETTLIDGNKIFTGDAYVDTLQIKGHAVTVPDVDTRDDTLAGNGTDRIIAIKSIYMSRPGWVYANFTAKQIYGSGVRNSITTLELGGESVEVGGMAVTTNIAIGHAVYLGIGTHTATVKWYGQDSGVTVSDRTLFVMGVKR